MKMNIRYYPGGSYFIGAVLACIVAANSAWGTSTSPWLKIETGEFVVYSDAPTKEVVECALRYAAFRRAFTELFGTAGSSLSPSTLIVFRTTKSFQARIPPTGLRNSETLNFSAEVDGTPLNAFAWAGDHDGALTSTFEFETIWSLQRLGYSVPVGMSQGAGEVLATLRISKGQCLIGHYGEHTNNNVLGWQQFFAINTSSTAYQNPRQLDDFLGEAWGLMHWILLKDAVGGEHFKAIANRLSHTSALEAITAEMHTEPDHLSKAISTHLAQTPFRSLPFDETAERARLIPAPATEPEVYVQMANLLGAAQQFAASDAELNRARAIAPDLPVVKEAYARRMEREGRNDEALLLYREAISAGSKNVSAYLLSANARLDYLRTGGGDVGGAGGKQAELALDELRQAIRLNPGNHEAYRLLGRAFFVRSKVGEEDVNELSPGVIPEENGGTVRYYRALLYSRLGHMEKSHEDLLEIIRDNQLPVAMRQSAKSRYLSEVLTADSKRIELLLSEKNYSAARAVTDAATAGPDDESVRSIYKKLRSLIDEQEAKESPK